VNLERAAAMNGRNSGHMVQGHVDDVGTIIETWPDNESLFFKVIFPEKKDHLHSHAF
jgi:riboflavin synthase